MGFRYKDKRQQYKLTFADEDMNGLEIIVTKLPLRFVLRMRELSAAGPQVSGGPAAMRELLDGVIGSMLSWNMENDDGTPMELNVDALMGLDEDFVQKVISSWTLALGGVPGPLDDGSTTGDAALEASIPMETLSPNPSS